ncbi:MAG TPA: Flp pilus assembly protein CpaB [Pirellulales bacterium]|nr:Flp pilus assembly protein CpaB [Pirellulales bacterium]
MRPKSIVLLILALGCGLVASIGINQVMANRRATVEVVGTETTPIYVALADIAMGDPLTLQSLKLEEWPKDKVQPGALGNLEDVEGRRCRVKIFAGEPILEPKLLAKGETQTNATDLIPKGFRVVAVNVNAVSSASGLIQPGDRVDLLVHVKADPNRGIPSDLTRTFLQNVKVFAIDDKFTRPEEGETSITVKTILLLITPEQCELVMLATKLGEIQLVMRSSNDDLNVDTAGVGAKELLSGKSPGDEAESPPANPAQLLDQFNQAKTEPLAPIAAELPPQKAFMMRVLRGVRAEEVFFTDEGRLPQAQGTDVPANIGPTPAAGRDVTTTDDAGPDDGGADDATSDDAGDDAPAAEDPTEAEAGSKE